MVIAYILLGLGSAFLFFILIQRLNEWGEAKTGHTFFTTGSIFSVSLGYWLIALGMLWAKNAQSTHGDILNGFLTVSVGAAIVISVVVYHLNHCPENNEVTGPMLIAFLILCIPMSIGLFIIVLGLIGLFSQTKPVYTVNHFFEDD